MAQSTQKTTIAALATAMIATTTTESRNTTPLTTAGSGQMVTARRQEQNFVIGSVQTVAETKERPILFSSPMVRAILAGSKTQTRRVFKIEVLPPVARWVMSDHWWIPEGVSERVKQQFISTWPNPIRCPYGQPGDRLWLRETFITGYTLDDNELRVGDERVWYRADGEIDSWLDEDGYMGDAKWRPSIFMPRALSRITLEITGVRVERLQDISEQDAKAEGCGLYVPGHGFIQQADLAEGYSNYLSPRMGFECAWNSINGPGSWDANPWVWVVEFKRVANS
jgi:hypothetical protein